jgi:hypothetical protein
MQYYKCAACPVHLIHLNMIALTKSGEESEFLNFAVLSIIRLFPLPRAHISSSGNYSEKFIVRYHHYPG